MQGLEVVVEVVATLQPSVFSPVAAAAAPAEGVAAAAVQPGGAYSSPNPEFADF